MNFFLRFLAVLVMAYEKLTSWQNIINGNFSRRCQIPGSKVIFLVLMAATTTYLLIYPSIVPPCFCYRRIIIVTLLSSYPRGPAMIITGYTLEMTFSGYKQIAWYILCWDYAMTLSLKYWRTDRRVYIVVDYQPV